MSKLVRFCQIFSFSAFMILGVHGAREERSLTPLIVAVGGFVSFLLIDRLLFGKSRR